MEPRKTRDEFPFWVKVGLLGVPGRTGVWFFFWLSIVFAVGFIAYGFWDPRFFIGFLWFFAALMYWLTIRWVDKYGVWK